jgi:hypothetical protein
MAHVELAQPRRRPIIGYLLVALGLSLIGYACSILADGATVVDGGWGAIVTFDQDTMIYGGLGVVFTSLGILWLRR